MMPNDEPDDFLGLRYERTPEDNRVRAKAWRVIIALLACLGLAVGALVMDGCSVWPVDLMGGVR